jgi:predicted peptidase
MEPVKLRPKKGPEALIQLKIIKKLMSIGWYVMVTHGSQFQSGFPDLYATHVDVGGRWIEVKNPLKYCFTPAQQKCFPLLSAHGTPIWILTSDDDDEIKKGAFPIR